MKAEELTELDAEELASRLRDSRRELYELRFKLAVGQLDDHRQIPKVRHDIARILTSLRQRELGLLREEDETPAVAVAEGTSAAMAANAARAAAEAETVEEEGSPGTS